MPTLHFVAGALLASALTAGPAQSLAAAHRDGAPASPAAPFVLNGARLGMSLAAWRALPWTGASASHVADVCAHGSLTPAPAMTAPPRAAAEAAVLDCRYVARYGAFRLPESFPLEGRFLARDPVFKFSAGQLAEIRFHSSVDAFNVITAQLDKAYGPPVRTIRDAERFAGGETMPRVRSIWRAPAGPIILMDPSSDPRQLEVRLDGAASARSAGAD